MKNYVKKFDEFINESVKSIGRSNVDNMWNAAGEDQDTFETMMKEQLQTIDVKEFMEYFTDTTLHKLSQDMEDSLNGDIDSFELDLEDDKTFGEFGIIFNWYKKLNGKIDDILITAYCGELDITESELGKAMINVFFKCMDSAKDNFELSVQSAKDIEDTYRSICQSNGWSY